MKVVVAGSRSIEDYESLMKLLVRARKELDITEVISGGAKGVDQLAETWARAGRSCKLTVMRADWKRHGNAAGFIRNQEMVNAADAAVVLWDGSSRGAEHTIACAIRKGIPLLIGRWESTWIHGWETGMGRVEIWPMINKKGAA